MIKHFVKQGVSFPYLTLFKEAMDYGVIRHNIRWAVVSIFSHHVDQIDSLFTFLLIT